MFIEPDVPSSFRRGRGHGQTFYDLVMKLKPKIIIEFGTMCGYSTISMAEALKDLGEGKIYAHDIGVNPYHRMLLMENIERYKVGAYIEIGDLDFNEWLKNPTDFDLLYVDVDNTGETIKKLQRFSGLQVIFEGGIPERDTYPGKENNTPIVGSADYEVINETFPGLSKLK